MSDIFSNAGIFVKILDRKCYFCLVLFGPTFFLSFGRLTGAKYSTRSLSVLSNGDMFLEMKS